MSNLEKINDSDPVLYKPSGSRRLSEVVDAAKLLDRQWWYEWHLCLKKSIENGETIIFDKNADRTTRIGLNTIERDVWELAQQGARNVVEKYGKDNFLPRNEFEVGMIAGKLSALRWILCDDWDSLDV